jgi:hypothetical protein
MRGLPPAWLLAVTGSAQAHGPQYSIDRGRAVSVRISCADGRPFDFESKTFLNRQLHIIAGVSVIFRVLGLFNLFAQRGGGR